MVWMVTVVLLFLSSQTLCTNPALKVRVTQNALDYGRQVGMQVLQEELKKINIPDQRGRARRLRYQISRIHIRTFNIARSTMAFSPGTGMKLSLDNVFIAVRGNWRMKYRFIRDSGSFHVSVNSLSVSELIRMSSDQTGRPAVKSAGCRANVGRVRIKLRGGASWLYNLFRRPLERRFRSLLNRQICPEVSKVINKLEPKMKTLKVTANIDRIAEIDYSLVNPPVVTRNFMDLDFKGEFYNIGRHQEPPFTAGPLSFPEQTNHMMYLAVSEFFFNSAAFVYHRAGALQINITDSMIPESFPIRLSTSTFGGFIPQLKELYPEMLMLMKIRSLKPPVLRMTPDSITIAVTGAADTFAILPNSSLAPLFVLNLDVSVSATPSLSGDKLTGSLEIKSAIENQSVFCERKYFAIRALLVHVTQYHTGRCTQPSVQVTPPSVSAVASSLLLHRVVLMFYSPFCRLDLSMGRSNIGPFETSSLEGVLSFATKIAVLPKINALLAKGYPLPSLDRLSFVNPAIKVKEKFLMIATDIKYRL
ncbi:bactericidal permeability-increasing protein-like [Callorhinchus milii]|uniref:bactericidal permeability-increasing protein-like n=1 Tax=Callorhinchus milii TaxID=7868 RepID=UPI001C3FD6B5|nr:bactericidal permeability-increasing protein-like [Callorhinchus milii]